MLVKGSVNKTVKLNVYFCFYLFQRKSFFYKFCYAIATTKVSVMKYQAVWLIAVSNCKLYFIFL